tara:strand:+ start:402 stop:2174 length:1773 start_codon:yes stop_codon:yes gene_type:complete
MKTLLLFPCQWYPTQPYLSTPYLTSYLQSKGWDIVQRDFNILSYDLFLSRPFLEKAVARSRKKIDFLSDKSSLTEVEKVLLEVLSVGDQYSGAIMSRVDEAKNVMRSPEHFFKFETYQEAHMIIKSALKLISDAWFPSMLNFLTYRSGSGAEESSKKAQTIVSDRDTNPFIELYEDFLIAPECWEDYRVLGISIIGTSQIIPGLTLARMLKKRYPHLFIVLGGPIFSVISEKLKKWPEFFDEFCHAIITFEGEEPLDQLLNSIKSGASLDGVPNLIYKNNGQVKVSERKATIRFNEIPPPTFDGLPLDLYFSPYPVLPVLQSRGCYWGKCTFCTHSYIYGQRYSLHKNLSMVDQLESFSKKYKTKYFTFSDEAVSPQALKGLSDQIIKRGLDFSGLVMLRFEKKMDADLFSKMKKAGFDFLLYGLESANDRILSLMEKGNSSELACENLRMSAEAGIWNHLFLFFGFPTETWEEAMDTIEFIKENRKNIHSFAPGVFTLNKDSVVYNYPERFSITQLIDPPDMDISTHLSFEASKGMAIKSAEKASNLCVEKMNKLFPGNNIWGGMPREHFLLYLDHYGVEALNKNSSIR